MRWFGKSRWTFHLLEDRSCTAFGATRQGKARFYYYLLQVITGGRRVSRFACRTYRLVLAKAYTKG